MPGGEHVETFGSDGHILDLVWYVDYMSFYISPNLTDCILKFPFHWIYICGECSKVTIYIRSQIVFSITIQPVHIRKYDLNKCIKGNTFFKSRALTFMYREINIIHNSLQIGFSS